MCEFAEATVNYHGKVVGQDEVCPVLAEVETIDKYPVTAPKKDLVQLPGLVGSLPQFFFYCNLSLWDCGLFLC